MLYVFHGSDREKILKRTETFLSDIFLSDPTLTFERFDTDSFQADSIQSLAGAQSLFGGKTVILTDDVLSIHESLLDILETLKLSEHTFVVREGALKKDQIKELSKHAEKIEEFESKEGKKKEFNIFAFTDAIGARNKKDAWVLYQKALLSGMTADEIFWKVMWQVKSLLLSEKTKNAEEAGLNPYVYQKAKGFVRNFKKGELEELSEKLVISYQQVRRGHGDMETLVEKTLLKL